ncbi:MAG: tetratricopeptide repeat protein [Thermodesulfobacteriota bacterium]
MPRSGSPVVPLWNFHWEKARQAALAQKYSEAVQSFHQALTLKPNLDEARLELAQVLRTMERWAEASKELGIVAENQPLNSRIQKDLADLLSQQKEYRRANERYQWLLQKDPDNLSLRLSLASNFYQLNELEKALIEWRQILIRDPQHLEARIHLADVLGATRRLDESTMILEGLVKQFPRQTNFKKKLAQNLVASKRTKEALPYLQELIRSDPGDADIQLLLAQVLSAGKQYDQSLTYLEAYLKKKPDQSAALLEKARALFYTGEYGQALEIFEKLTKNDPGNLDLQREVADVYFSSGKISEALSAYESLSKKLPNEYPLHERIGELNIQNKNYPKAAAAFELALGIEPENHYAQLNLARAYNLSGEKEKALRMYRSILQVREDRLIRIEMADLLYDLKQFPETFAIFRQLLKEQPGLWEVRFKLASGLFQQKEYRSVSEQLEILIREQPENAAVRILSGYNALAQGDYLRAQKAFQRALALGEDTANTLLRLGELYRLLGRPWQGMAYLDWALNLKPGDMDIMIEKAQAFSDGGGLVQARRILEPLSINYPEHFKVQRAWVRMLAALDRTDETEAGWKNLEKKFPQDQELIFQDRADYYLKRGKKDSALTALKAARIRAPQQQEVLKKIGRLLLEMGRWEEAEIHYLDLEKKKILLEEVYGGKALIRYHQGRFDSSRELLWMGLVNQPDSVRIRFWIKKVMEKIGSDPGNMKKMEQALLEFARTQEGGLLDLADQYRKTGDSPKAYTLYHEIFEKEEADDDLIRSAILMREVFPKREKATRLQEYLENLQKRFPRNQRISRLLIEHYNQEKEYDLAIKTIDGLLKIEDPLDPVLLTKKGRILERWNKHGDSQAAFQSLLDPTVDTQLLDRIRIAFPDRGQSLGPFLKEIEGAPKTALYNGMYEEIQKRIPVLLQDREISSKLLPLLEDLEAHYMIQKKVFLEKEGKDHLWRRQFSQARPLFEELKVIDPDNEDVEQDIYQSYRNQNL